MAMTLYFFVLRQGGWEYGDVLPKTDPLYLQATTACLAAIVVAQVVNVFACRHPRESAFRFRPADNPLLLAGVATEVVLILIVVYTPAGHSAIGTAPLDPAPWALMILLALTFGLLEDVRKFLLRRAGVTARAAAPPR
jgi:magnesium-transporting ATPase (P-type)